ncbi:MAG: DNA repair protein RecO [Bacteroidales bacterium]|nr:DNA repair protein RecO [Bacteroidales bacterium]
MYESLQGIVLNTIKYNDRHNITHIYTDRHGRMSFLVAQGKTAAARMRMSMFMPLSLLQFEARILPGKDLCTLHDVRRTHALHSLYASPVKNAVAMFVSEVLTHCIQEHEQNEGLYQYISTSVRLLEALTEGEANFHICFLYHLGSFLGIEPDMTSYREGYWFNMAEGTFHSRPTGVGHNLRPEQARVIYLLSRMNFSNLHIFRFNREERNQMLDTILAYYRLHNSTLGTLRSPEILKQLFV